MLSHFPASLPPMDFFCVAALWWPVSRAKHILLLLHVGTWKWWVYYFPSGSKFISNFSFLFPFFVDFFSSVSCVGLTLSFFSMSRLKWIAFLSWLVRAVFCSSKLPLPWWAFFQYPFLMPLPLPGLLVLLQLISWHWLIGTRCPHLWHMSLWKCCGTPQWRLAWSFSTFDLWPLSSASPWGAMEYKLFLLTVK